MRTPILLALLAACLLVPTAARAGDVDIDFSFNASFGDDSPDLVYVEPGVYAVVDHSYPVVVADGYFWTHHHDRWWRTRSYGARWVPVEVRVVPQRVVGVPLVRYRSFHPTSDHVLVYSRDVRGHYDGRGAVPPGHLKHHRAKAKKHDSGRSHGPEARGNSGRGHGNSHPGKGNGRGRGRGKGKHK